MTDEGLAIAEGVAALATRLEVVVSCVEAMAEQGAPLARRVDEVERRLDHHTARLERLERRVRRLWWSGAAAFVVGLVVGLHLGAG